MSGLLFFLQKIGGGAKIFFVFKKSFLEEQGLTKEDVERGLAELARYFRKAFAPETIRTWEGKKYIKGADTELKKSRGRKFPIGTIREWNGKK